MQQRLIRIFSFIIGIFLVISLGRSIIDIWQKGGLLDNEEERFAKARLENEELKQEFSMQQSPKYIEKQAREKLGLAREGEAVVVLPPKIASQANKQEENNPPKQSEEPVWQQWVNFFIN